MKRRRDSEEDERFLKRRDDEYTLCLSDLEKKIVLKSLVMISKASVSDWNYERSQDMMILHTYNMIDEILYEIVTEVSYVEEETECRVLYRSSNAEYLVLFYKWDNDILNNEIHFCKFEEEKFLFLFSRSVKKTLKIDCHNSWCHFQDARFHLQNLSSR
jgi:hypothetical protein